MIINYCFKTERNLNIRVADSCCRSSRDSHWARWRHDLPACTVDRPGLISRRGLIQRASVSSSNKVAGKPTSRRTHRREARSQDQTHCRGGNETEPPTGPGDDPSPSIIIPRFWNRHIAPHIPQRLPDRCQPIYVKKPGPWFKAWLLLEVGDEMKPLGESHCLADKPSLKPHENGNSRWIWLPEMAVFAFCSSRHRCIASDSATSP
jgi:hypothetical protein